MKTVAEMAREAGLSPIYEACDVPDVSYAYESWDVELERFAELVRADERNSWPAEMEAMERQVNILTDALAQEREACAKVAEDSDHVVAGRGYYDQLGDADATARNITAAIRARSNT